MSQYEVNISGSPQENWNDTLTEGESESLALFHTAFWADCLTELVGYEPLFLSVNKDNQPLLRLALFSCSFLKVKGAWNLAVHTTRALLSLKTGTIQWYGQPVFFKEADETAYRLLAEAVDELARKKKVKLTGGEWPLEMGSVLPGHWKMQKWASLKVDLTRELETIFSNFKPAARKAIKKAQRDGITVRRTANENELLEYGRFATNCAKRYGKRNFRGDDYLLYQNKLRQKNFIFETFYAEHLGQIIAGLSVYGDKKRILEMGSFQSEKSFREKLYGPDLIKWHIIQWAKSSGIRQFDLAGINPDPSDPKERNIRKFKEKWGGVYFEYLVVRR